MSAQRTQPPHGLAEVPPLLDALAARGFAAHWAPHRAAALRTVLDLLPPGAEVMTGGSTTLDQLGLPAALRQRGHRYLKDEVHRETDPGRRDRLRREATLAEWFVGSVNALTRDGVLVAADGSGSRLGGYVFGSRNVVLVVSVNKVEPDLEAAMRRVREVALPREDERVRALTGRGSATAKWLLWEREFTPGRAHVVLVGEPLGF